MVTDNFFKIIKIIDEYNIVVNAGNQSGIKESDKLEVFIIGNPIIDPDTGEELGTLDTIKSKLVVKQVYPKFCICTNAQVINVGLLANNLFTEIKKLNVDTKQISGGFKNEDLKIRIGDLVRKSLS